MSEVEPICKNCFYCRDHSKPNAKRRTFHCIFEAGIYVASVITALNSPCWRYRFGKYGAAFKPDPNLLKGEPEDE